MFRSASLVVSRGATPTTGSLRIGRIKTDFGAVMDGRLPRCRVFGPSQRDEFAKGLLRGYTQIEPPDGRRITPFNARLAKPKARRSMPAALRVGTLQ